VRKASTAFIFVTVLLDMIAFGIMVPVFNPLVLSFTQQNYTNAAFLGGIFSTIFAVVQLFSSPLLGSLADRFGRRPIILLSNFGTALDYGILALAPNLAWLFVGRVLSGATTASVTVANAYIADVTPEDKRAGAYGMIGACFGIGFVVGPVIGGLLAAHGLRLPFWVAAVLSFANFLYGLVILPESLDREHRNAFSWKRANPFGAVKLLRRHVEISGLAIVSLIDYLAGQALPQLWVFYVLLVFSWNMSTLGASLAVVGVATIVVSAFLTQPVVNLIGERRAILLGLILGAAGFALYGFGNEVLFWIAIPINMLWMISSSAAQAVMTRRVGKHEQGELQGALNLLRSVAMIVGPLLFTFVFAYSVSSAHAWKTPGAGWVLAACLLLIAAAVAWRVTGTLDDVREPINATTTLESAVVADLPVVE
jgi:DHA1 family tetracycline resistance protein-like MFS transporter